MEREWMALRYSKCFIALRVLPKLAKSHHALTNNKFRILRQFWHLGHEAIVIIISWMQVSALKPAGVVAMVAFDAGTLAIERLPAKSTGWCHNLWLDSLGAFGFLRRYPSCHCQVIS